MKPGAQDTVARQLAEKFNSNLGLHGSKLEVGERLMADLMSFKKAERKDDPERRAGLHGPYEEITRIRNLREKGAPYLPDDYYDADDHERNSPWGLRIESSRSNILWQVLSGILDHEPVLASSYMSLALDSGLSLDDYAKELGKLHSDLQKYAMPSNHKHHAVMADHYNSVSCPACSMLTAMAVKDANFHALFVEKLLPLKTATERRALLIKEGISPLLNTMVFDDIKLVL